MVQSRVAVRSSGMQDDDKVSRGGKRKESPMRLAGMNGGACIHGTDMHTMVGVDIWLKGMAITQ